MLSFISAPDLHSRQHDTFFRRYHWTCRNVFHNHILQLMSLRVSEPSQNSLSTSTILTISASQKQVHWSVGKKIATPAKAVSSLGSWVGTGGAAHMANAWLLPQRHLRLREEGMNSRLWDLSKLQWEWDVRCLWQSRCPAQMPGTEALGVGGTFKNNSVCNLLSF